jgi:hypothetical protein
VCDNVIVSCLINIGDAWLKGEITIAGEHRASAICERALGLLTPAPPGRPRGVALVCSPPGDDHQLPGEMADARCSPAMVISPFSQASPMFMRQDTITLSHTSADVVHMADDEQPALVVISVTWPPARTLAQELADQLAAPGRRVLVGQPGMTLTDLVFLARGESPLQEVGSAS